MNIPVKHTAADTTIFTVMSALAQKHNAINLSQGFPDYEIDPSLKSYLAEAAASNWNQYAPMIGLEQLRTAIAQNYAGRYGDLRLDAASEITITPGATYGIYTALATVLNAGDEVIFFEPAYDSYRPNIEMLGAVPVAVEMTPPGYTIDWDKVKAAISNKTRAIIINNPHNPTGTLWSKEDLLQLQELLSPTGIFLIADEVYEQITFDGRKHYSVLEFPELRARSFAIYSFGKLFHSTGWKVGYVIAPPAMSGAFRKLHQFLAFSVNTPAQYAFAKLLAGDRGNLSAFLQEKRDYFMEAVKGLPFDVPGISGGTYFQVLSYKHFSKLGDSDFAKWLCENIGVACIPLSAFYQDRTDHSVVRFCFAKKKDTIDAAIERLQKLR